MINDKDFFLDRIKKITDPEQQKYLHDVLHDVFKAYAEYCESRYIELENKIKAEIPDNFEDYYIYTTVTSRDNYNDLSDFWYEAGELPGDETTASVAARVFLNCGYDAIKPYINQFVHADVITDKNEYINIRLKIDFSRIYQNGIKRLYEIFSLNGKPWLTINCPFMFKFLDLIDESGAIPKDETITGYKLKDFELDKYIIDNMVLLWNVQRYSVKSRSSKYVDGSEASPFPTESTILYDHKIKIKFPDSKYMFYGDNLKNFYSLIQEGRENVISVISENVETDDISVYRIAKDIDSNIKMAFPSQSNARKMRHTDRQAEKRRGTVFTEAEIERICDSYIDINASLRLADISISDSGDFINNNDLNYFIKTDKIDSSRKKLILKFKVMDRADIFLYEKMWFLVSELQFYFNEYQCIGKLVV